MGAGKGFDYYRNTYTHEELWEMLITQGDPWSVEQGGSMWTTAKGGLETARDQLDSSMLATVDYWQGPASEEFQRRMRLVYEYSQTAEEDMMQMAESWIPDVSQALSDAQTSAQNQDLSPASELEYEDWLEDVKNVKPEDPDYLTKQEQYRNEYEQYRSDRHDAMARIVADLGDRYKSESIYGPVEGPPPPPPSDMPGNTTYQPPTGGVFGQDGLSNPDGLDGAPGSDGGLADRNGDGIPDSEQGDLDPVEDWAPGSYENVDSDINGGGLAGGGLSPIGGGGYTGGTVPTGGTGGTSFTGAGTGLFGPARGSGTGPAPGRGTTGTTSPARSGANTSGGRGSGSGSGRGMGPGSNTSGRGMNNRGMGPRGGTRSGYYDDDEEEETTRETWLREDDINWSRNRTSDEELDD
ncbi:WXG100 family type VII secretion target [Glycomyces tenuis]|uniref:WXG100 family type VII secretion target n=1 Tax=Glycomyces tenuis TaxID=58116 RepID=UPI00041002A5|nr:hypothetical protein [Glycomyces tenuis]